MSDQTLSNLSKLSNFSPFFARLMDADASLVDFLRQQQNTPFETTKMRAHFGALWQEKKEEANLNKALRVFRKHILALLMVRDIEKNAPLAEIMGAMTFLAELVINETLAFWHQKLVEDFGAPLDEQGNGQRLMIVGMGKLGGGELNVSSDIDLIFIYPEEGKTFGGEGKRSIENHDFFNRLAKKIIASLDEMTADGFVFRVDMRLRPNGDSGALVCSLASFENYLVTQGREWERYAWIKARLINQNDNLQTVHADNLSRTARPFIFRKYLDFGAINAMSELHAQIRREVAKKGMENHIKLGKGGIREIEFVAQVFQLMRGGRDLALQQKATLSILEKLGDRQLLSAEALLSLQSAYDFLRKLEHRLQYVEDAQTHSLPVEEGAQRRMAESMNFANYTDFLAVLNQHRAQVSAIFEGIFSEDEAKESPFAPVWFEEETFEESVEVLNRAGFLRPKEALENIQRFRQSAKYRELPSVNKERLDAVCPRLLEAVSHRKNADIAWSRGFSLIETISKRGAYLALFQQYPVALKRVANIVASSAWAFDYLVKHPIVLDEIIDPKLYEPTSLEGFASALLERLQGVLGDAEREMDILREAHHAEVFRLLAQDIAGMHTVEALADHLTALADILLKIIVNLCWEKIRQKHSGFEKSPKIAVIAYGKLGGKELSYGSDLDLVFVHDDNSPNAGEHLARLVQRVNTWLTTKTPAGALFETDFRLRPNGEAGLLVSSITSFADYQRSKAWTWEHQALTRARFCVGDQSIGAQFEALRIEILTRQRDFARLKEEVETMRDKMRAQHAVKHSPKNADLFDLKQDKGGLIDVEFIVQTLVLAHAHQHKSLTQNLGNLALLSIAAKLNLIPPKLAENTQTAYRAYRKKQHALRQEGFSHAQLPKEEWAKEIAAVHHLWAHVFGENNND